MKSINDMTWKDAAVVEARALCARLEGLAGQAGTTELAVKADVLNGLARQATRLSEVIEKIDEVPAKPRPRGRAKLKATLVEGAGRMKREKVLS